MKVTLNWKEKFYTIHADEALDIPEQRIDFDEYGEWNTIYKSDGPLFDCQIDFDEEFQFQYVNLLPDTGLEALSDIFTQGDDWRNADEFIIIDEKEGIILEGEVYYYTPKSVDDVVVVNFTESDISQMMSEVEVSDGETVEVFQWDMPVRGDESKTVRVVVTVGDDED